MTIRHIRSRVYVKTLSIFIVMVVGSLSSYLFAADSPDKIELKQQASNDWERISDEELDTLRGGFSLPSGLIVDFSFDKRIYQNGIEAFYTYFELPQNIALSRGATSDIASNLTNMLLNSVTQNSLDNQIIKTINTINIDISNIKNVNYDSNRSAFFRNLVGPTYK
jgi:hypothetical protein